MGSNLQQHLNISFVSFQKMGMRRIDYKRMEAELRRIDPEAISEFGYSLNAKTRPVLEKYNFLQKREEYDKAVKRNQDLLKEFKAYLQKRDENQEWKKAILAWLTEYEEFNEMSGWCLAFDEMGQEHFNYILYNRFIRKCGNRSTDDLIKVQQSLGVFTQFLKEKKIKNYELFESIFKQPAKAKKRMAAYHKIQEDDNLSEEEYGLRMYQLFGYGYFE